MTAAIPKIQQENSMSIVSLASYVWQSRHMVSIYKTNEWVLVNEKKGI